MFLKLESHIKTLQESAIIGKFVNLQMCKGAHYSGGVFLYVPFLSN